ncbi:MAG: MATE family efflux transporter, partial [Schwartzia sp.]|nr:MATE family efflux transporter [Schwartzia sp. (in: firmicutes)]
MAKSMTEGDPARLILYFTLPLIAGNIFQQMYSFVDTLIVGRFLGVQALAAVGCTGSLMFLMIGFVMGTSTGLSIYTGQRFGARDEVGVRRSAAACAVLTGLISLALTIFGVLAVRPLLLLMETPPEIYEDAVSFISIIYAGVPLMMLFAMQTNLIRSLGDSRTPTIMLACGLGLNILFEPIFIIGLGWGVPGAALATVFSQVVANLLGLFYICRRVTMLVPRREDWRLTRRELVAHLRLGLPMGFQASVIALGAIILQVALNNLGPLAVAAYAAAQKVDTIAIMPMMSFGMALAAYTAQNYGARRFDRIWLGVKKGILMSGAFSIFIGVVMVLGGRPIIELFVGPEETQVIEYGRLYLNVNGLCYFILSLLFIFRFTLQGLGQTIMPTVAGIMELVMRAVAAIFLVDWLG